MFRLTLVVSACIVATAPALAQSKPSIDKLNAKFAEAFKKGDAAAVAGMYTMDAVVLPPRAEMVIYQGQRNHNSPLPLRSPALPSPAFGHTRASMQRHC
jgi:hypothetical protein